MILHAYHAFVAVVFGILSNDLLSLVTRLGVAARLMASLKFRMDPKASTELSVFRETKFCGYRI
jgi:hypothetical protein